MTGCFIIQLSKVFQNSFSQNSGRVCTLKACGISDNSNKLIDLSDSAKVYNKLLCVGSPGVAPSKFCI